MRHDNTVTWLAYWKDPIDSRSYKYVWLGANSTFKTEADLEKYEKARKLKDHIDRIREDYRCEPPTAQSCWATEHFVLPRTVHQQPAHELVFV